MKIKERVTYLLDIKKIPKEAFYTKIGVTSANFRGKAKNTPLNSTAIENILSEIPDLNPEWLITGEGKILRNAIDKKIPHNTIGNGVPYFEDIESSGGIIPSMNEIGIEIPTFYINYEHFNDCTAYLQHVGDSMYPKYCSGEIIAVKRIYNFDVVLWGEAHLVVTNDNANNLRTVKLLFQHEDPSRVILRASNPNYKGDTVVSKNDIISLFIVKGKITRNQL